MLFALGTDQAIPVRLKNQPAADFPAEEHENGEAEDEPSHVELGPGQRCTARSWAWVLRRRKLNPRDPNRP